MRRSDTINLLCRMSVLLLFLMGASSCTKSGVEQFESPLSSTTIVSPLQVPTPPIATLPPLTLEPNCGGAKGTIVKYPADWTGSQLYVYFSPFYSAEHPDEGFYVLEPSVHPSISVAAGGAFQAGNIPPGQYVVVVGPTPQESIPILDGTQPRIFNIQESVVLEIGDVFLKR